MLHITNGDSTVARLEGTLLPGRIIAWNDVLHEGPASAELTLEELRDVRARFIAGCSWAAYDVVLGDFTARDAALAQFQDHAEVVLWFEHDLYDQLQLIQLLDWFAQHDPGASRLSLICIGAFPGVEPFHGLGQLTPEQLLTLFPGRQAVSPAQLNLGRAAWQAFCAPEPTAIEALLQADTSALPFLQGALIRHLEQFPAQDTGLGRTERQILESIDAGIQQPIELFLADQRKEEQPFMGDATFWWYIQGLSAEPHPLLLRTDGGQFLAPGECSSHAEFAAQNLALTEAGAEVLYGHTDWLRSRPIDRWRGGVHLQGQGPLWRWDRQNRRVVRDAR